MEITVNMKDTNEVSDDELNFIIEDLERILNGYNLVSEDTSHDKTKLVFR